MIWSRRKSGPVFSKSDSLASPESENLPNWRSVSCQKSGKYLFLLLRHEIWNWMKFLSGFVKKIIGPLHSNQKVFFVRPYYFNFLGCSWSAPCVIYFTTQFLIIRGEELWSGVNAKGSWLRGRRFEPLQRRLFFVHLSFGSKHDNCWKL